MQGQPDRKVRFGIIGSAGLIGNYHVGVLTAGKGAYVLTALCDIDEPRLREQCGKLNLPGTTRAEELVARDDVDAVIVATPHPLHVPQALLAMKAGKDVISEKPLSNRPGEARRLIKAARSSDRLVGIHYQQRGRPAAMKAKEMLRAGLLGKLLSIRVTASYYKTDYYYTLGGWRGTWKDEGGGVLINQAPHDIDLMCYLAAEAHPAELTARWTNLFHDNSQVEDIATAAGRFANGVEFSLQQSVATHGEPPRIELLGTSGALTLQSGELRRYVRFEKDSVDFARTYPGNDPYAGPAVREEPIPQTGPFDASLLHQRFAEAVLTRDKGKLLVSAEEGLWSMETISAMYLSGYSGRPVKLPVAAGRYDRMLDDLSAKARPVDRGAGSAQAGMAAKF